MVTLSELPSICVKSAESTPSVPMDLSMPTWLLKIRLHVSRRRPQSHAFTSSAIKANAGSGRSSAESTMEVAAKASTNLWSRAMARARPMASPLR